jgi:hypothetical protein
MAEAPHTEAIVRRIAGFGLRDDQVPLTIEPGVWKQVLASLDGNRITGFALAGAEEDWLSLTADQVNELVEAHRRAMLAPLAVERGLLEVGTAFRAGGVDFVVLKGPALAHTVYPDPSWRYFGDLDLLVRKEDWREAASILQGLGYRRNLPEPRAGFDLRFGKASEFRRTGGIEIDLHRTLVVGPFGLWIESQVLLEGTTEFTLWSQKFKRLDDTLLQLHACVHASLGWWPPLRVPVRDVAQVAYHANVDWDALAELATRWKLRAVVSHALRLTAEGLGIDPPAEAQPALAQKATRKERRALQSYVTNRRNLGGTTLWTLRAIRGLRAKAAYVLALALPNREFLTARSGGRRASYWGRWAVPLRWMRSRRRTRQ